CLNGELDDYPVGQLLAGAQVVDPVQQLPELVGCARREAGVEGPSVTVAGDHVRGERGGCVAGRLAPHDGVGYQPVVGRLLGGDVGGGMHAHVDQLPHAREVPCVDGNERGDGRPHRSDVEGLVAATPDRGKRVVVVAAVPHRAAAGEDGEVGDRLV